MWVNSTVSLNSQYLFDARVIGATTAWAFGWNLGSGAGVLAWSFAGAGVTSNGTGGLSTRAFVLPNVWYSIAYVRRSNVGYIYVNGVQQATAADSTNYSINNTTAYIGQRYSVTAGNYWQGYMTNFRVVKETAIMCLTLLLQQYLYQHQRYFITLSCFIINYIHN
jgi:hypothetical protein